MSKKPSFSYYLIGWMILILGFLDALYLCVSHYRVYTDIGYASFCAVSKAINCDTVSQSSFSILFGMPVPVWGVLGYGFLILIFPFLFQKKNSENRLWTLFFVIVSLFSVYSLVLAFVSTYYIHSYCLMCVGLYAVNLALFFYSYRIFRTDKNTRFFGRLVKDMGYLKSTASPLLLSMKAFCVMAVVLWFFFPKYWTFEIKKEMTVLPSGITEDGSPWMGARNPEITIVEYTDYLCFQCKKMHFYLRSLVAKHPDRIRLVHKNFPLDAAFNFAISENLHTGAGQMAMLATYAGFKGRFWEMNDLLFQMDHSRGTIGLNEIAMKLKLDTNELSWALEQDQIRLHLKKEIAQGAKAGVTGTPAYIINGKLFLGTIPTDLLATVR